MTNLVTNALGVILGMTPAFKQYALTVLLAQASHFTKAWHLELVGPISTNSVTDFRCVAKTNGLTGSVVLKSRYAWSIADGRVENFTDLAYYSRTLTSDDKECEALIRVHDCLSTNAAITVATSALSKIGIDAKALEKLQPTVKQYTYEADDRKYLLPLYQIDWGNLRMEVSGVTSNVASFFNVSGALRVETPTNYFDLLKSP